MAGKNVEQRRRRSPGTLCQRPKRRKEAIRRLIDAARSRRPDLPESELELCAGPTVDGWLVRTLERLTPSLRMPDRSRLNQLAQGAAIRSRCPPWPAVEEALRACSRPGRPAHCTAEIQRLGLTLT